MENTEHKLDIFSNLILLKLSRKGFIIQLSYIISNIYFCKTMLILRFKAYCWVAVTFVTK